MSLFCPENLDIFALPPAAVASAADGLPEIRASSGSGDRADRGNGADAVGDGLENRRRPREIATVFLKTIKVPGSFAMVSAGAVVNTRACDSISRSTPQHLRNRRRVPSNAGGIESWRVLLMHHI